MYKCPRCDYTSSSSEGLRKHAGLSHHLTREKGVWKEVYGDQARALVEKLRTQSSHHPATSGATSTQERRPKRVPAFPPPPITSTPSLMVPPAVTVSTTSAATTCPSSQVDAIAGSASSVTVTTTSAPPSATYTALVSITAIPPPVFTPCLTPTLQSESLCQLFTPSQFDPFLPNEETQTETEELRDAAASQSAATRVVYPQIPAPPHTSVVNETLEQGQGGSDSSSECSHCTRTNKRSHRGASPPPAPLTAPSREELVEWVFSHPNTHPSTLASAALTGRGLAPAYDGSLAQQIDDVRCTMVHYARLLLLAHNQARHASGDSPHNLETSLYNMAMKGIAPPQPK